MRELCRLLGLSFNSTRYHVDKLCVTGQIVRQPEKGFIRLYPAGLEARDKIVYSFLRIKRSRDVLIVLAKDPKLTFKEICDRTGLSKSTVSKCMHELVNANLVKLQTSEAEGTIIYEISDPTYLLQVLMNIKPPVGSRKNRSWD
jgi:predicted transcriptional regulator